MVSTRVITELAGVGIFFGLVIMVLQLSGDARLSENLHRTLIDAPIALVFVSAVVAAARHELPEVGLFSIVTAWMAAFIEEWVFRLALPSHLERVLGEIIPGKILSFALGCVLSALLFATAHFIGTGTAIDMRGALSFGRLFALGLVYSSLISTTTLGFVSGLHASLNVAAIHATRPGTAPTSPLYIVLIILAALIGLFIASWRLRLQRLTENRSAFSGSTS